MTALDRVLRSVSIQSSQLIHADSNASKEENSGKTKGRHPSVPRPTKTVSASNMNVAPTNTRLAKEISTSMADRNDVEEIELDFFCPPRAHSPPLSARDYDEDGVGNGAKRKSLLFSPPSFKDPADEKKAEARKAIPRGGWEAPLKNSKGQLVDQPVTFHTKIKSSGYGQVSNDPFQRRLEAKRKERTSRSNSAPRLRPSANGSTSNGTTAGRRNSALGQPSGAGVGGRIRTYPMDCAPMSSQLISWDYPDNVASSSAAASSNPIFHLAYSNDAMKLAVASQASVLLSMRLPRGASQREVTAYMGHNASIRQVSFSHSKLPEYCMMTSSVDGTARMWKSSRVESSAIVFSHYLHQCSTAMLPSTTTNPSTTSALSTTASAAATKKVSRNRPYGGEVSASQFFYQDKFILLVSHQFVSWFVFLATFSLFL